jgi:hypothetical protein
MTDLLYVAFCLTAFAAGVLYLPRLFSSSKGTISIRRPVQNSRIRIDGREIPTEDLARPLELTTGEHEVLATSGDKIIATKKITILPGENPALQLHEGSK